MKEYYAIIISMYCNSKQYIDEKNTCINTWGKSLPENILHICYTANPDQTCNSIIFKNNNILIPHNDDSRFDTYKKTIAAIEYILNNYKFKFLIKTNVSTYINIKNLLSCLEYKDINKDDAIYCTQTYLYDYGLSFRGDFNIFDYKTCIDFINTQQFILGLNYRHADDFLMSLSLNAIYKKFCNIKTIPSINAAQFNEYTFNQFKNIVAIRLKNKSDKKWKGVDTINLMNKIHNYISNEKQIFSFDGIFNEQKILNHTLFFKSKYIDYNSCINCINNNIFSWTKYNKCKDKYFNLVYSLIPPNTKCYHTYIYYSKQNYKQALKHYTTNIFIKKLKCFKKSPDLYLSYNKNNHHWTTTWCWNHIIPHLYKYFFNDNINKEKFKLINNKDQQFDLSYHELIDNSNIFEFIDYSSNIKLIGTHEILRCKSSLEIDNCKTNYHKLFIGSHHVCKIINKSIKCNRRLLLNCDSMSIPIIPIFANFFDEILVLDNRDKKSYKNIIKNFNPTDYLCQMLTINYYKENKNIVNLT